MSTDNDIKNLIGISDKDISKMTDTPMEKRKEKVSFIERLSEFKRIFFRLELLVCIPLLLVLGIILKKLKKDNIESIVSMVALLICEAYMFLRIDFASIESIIVGLIMGLLHAFILTSGSMYCLNKYE